MMTKDQIERELAKISAARRQSASVVTPKFSTPPSMSKEQIEAELAKIQAARGVQKKEGFMHRAGQYLRGLAQGIGAESDINPGGHPLYTMDMDLEGIVAKPTVAPMSEELPRTLGLGQEYEAGSDDTLGKVLNFGGNMTAPSSMMPLAGYGPLFKAAGRGAKVFGKSAAKELGMIGAQAAAIKGTPRFTEEGTGAGFLEDIAKGAVTGALPGVAGSIKGAIKAPKLSRNERAVHNYISGIVGEENIPGILERLREYKSGIGYEPLTAEVAGNPGFAQLQRALEGVAGSGIAEKEAVGARTIAEALRNSKLSDADMSDIQHYFINRLQGLEGDVENSLATLNPKLNETEAGRSVQDALHEELLERKRERSSATKPLYEKVRENTNPLEASNALKFLEEEVVAGDVEKDFNYFKRQLGKRDTKKEIASKSANKSNSDVELSGKFWLESYDKNKPQAETPKTTVAKLAAVRKAINSRIQKYKKSGEDERWLMLKKLKKHLDTDLKNIQEHAEAVSTWKEFSKPVSKITKNKALNSVTRNIDGQFLMSESRVPGVFINNTAGSIDDSRALLREMQNKPGALDDVRSYLNHKAAVEIMDESTGLVDNKKLEAFKKKYPGAKVLYPELYDTKLGDIKTAQNMVNRFLKNTEEVSNTLYKDTFGQYVAKDPSKAIKRIFSGDSDGNMKRLLSELDGDESLLNAARNETINHFEKSITNAGSAGEHNRLSYPKTKKFLEEHGKALQQVLTENQLNVVKEIGDITAGKNYAATEGMAKGSPTHANIRNALDFSKRTGYSMAAVKAYLTRLGIATPFVKEFFKDIRELQVQKNEAILSRAIRDPDYADTLLSTPLKSKTDFMDFINKSKLYSRSRYIPPEVRELMKESKKE